MIEIILSVLHTRFQSNNKENLAYVEQFIVDSKKINTSNRLFYGSHFDETKLELHYIHMLDIAKSIEFN